MDLQAHLDKISRTENVYEERMENVRELIRLAESYTEEGSCLGKKTEVQDILNDGFKSPLTNFLENIDLVADVPDGFKREFVKSRFTVYLMTIHSSKGMEFDSVFMVGNEEGTFPLAIPNLEEEKRLFYVSMTRAKTELIMTWRKQVWTSFKDKYILVNKQPSRFLKVVLTTKGKKEGNQNEVREDLL